jgi:DNA-binding PadR family transcriptional regulator
VEDYEEEILAKMFDEEIIAMDYRPTETIRSKINWTGMQSKYRIKKKFSTVMKRLENKGYVSSHGKSGGVYSLTQDGVHYVMGNQQEERNKDKS